MPFDTALMTNFPWPVCFFPAWMEPKKVQWAISPSLQVKHPRRNWGVRSVTVSSACLIILAWTNQMSVPALSFISDLNFCVASIWICAWWWQCFFECTLSPSLVGEELAFFCLSCHPQLVGLARPLALRIREQIDGLSRQQTHSLVVLRCFYGVLSCPWSPVLVDLHDCVKISDIFSWFGVSAPNLICKIANAEARECDSRSVFYFGWLCLQNLIRLGIKFWSIRFSCQLIFPCLPSSVIIVPYLDFIWPARPRSVAICPVESTILFIWISVYETIKE